MDKLADDEQKETTHSTFLGTAIVAGTLMFLPAIVVLILGRLGGQSAR
jgi:hypothetical protein